MKITGFIAWCNQNEGFLSAILTMATLLLSTLAMIMTYRLGVMPYKKKLAFVPSVYESEGNIYMELTVINCGNATVCIKNLSICNNKMLNIGMAGRDFSYITLKPCEYICKTVCLYDDLENIKENWLDLNGHITITAYDIDGKKYVANKGFPIG